MSVLAEGDVADPVQLVLDDPVPAHKLTDTGGVSLFGAQVADGVDDLAGPNPGAGGACAHDPCGQPGMGEPQPWVERVDELDGAVLGAPVAALEADVTDRDLRPRQGGEALVQARLVAFDGEDVVPAVAVQVVGVGSLGVQRVRSDDASVQVNTVQDGRERSDLVPLGRRGDLTQRDRRAVRDRREQVHPRPVAAPRATGGLAVHRDRGLPGQVTRGRGGPGAQDRVQDIGIDPGQQPGERCRRGRAPANTEAGPVRPRQVGRPRGDRDERAGAGADPGHRQGQHRGQVVPHPAPVAWIAQRGQHLPQLDHPVTLTTIGGVASGRDERGYERGHGDLRRSVNGVDTPHGPPRRRARLASTPTRACHRADTHQHRLCRGPG